MAVHFYFGKTGSGKSHKANQEIKKYAKRVIYDPTPTKSFTGTHETNDYSAQNLKQLVFKFGGKKEFAIVFRPNVAWSMEEQAERVAFFAIQLGSCFKKTNVEHDGIGVVFDELDKYVSTKNDSWIAKVAGMGRHYNLHLHCISQVPSRLPKFMRDNAYNIYAFALAENEFYREKLGDNLCKELASSNMQKYAHAHWSDENGIFVVNPAGKAVRYEGS